MNVRAFVFLVLAVLFAAVARGEDPPPLHKSDLTVYLLTTGKEISRRYWTQEIARLKDEVGRARKQRDKAATIDLVAELRSAEDGLRTLKPILPDMQVHRMAVGNVGRLRGVCGQGDDESASRAMRVIEAFPDNKLSVKMGTNEHQTVFIVNTSAKGVVKDAVLDAGDDHYEVIGTWSRAGYTHFEVAKFDVTPYVPQK